VVLVSAPAVVAELARLSDAERADRAALLAQGGKLAATMRAAEARAWPPGMLAELWRWATWLLVIRGFRGKTTVVAYVAHLGNFAAWLLTQPPATDWRDVNLDQLEGWLKSMFVARRHGKSHRSGACSAVKAFYRWRGARGYGRDCSLGLVAPKLDRRLPRKHTPAELRAIFATLPSARNDAMRLRDTALLLLLLASGLRREEVSRLDLREVVFDGRIAVIRVDGKGAKQREIAMEGPVVQALLAWIDHRNTLAVDHGALFVAFHARGGTVRLSEGGVERIVKRYARAAKVRHYGVHVFRVTFATHLYDDGNDLERIRIVMGHESIETTRGYLAVSNRQRTVRLKPHRQHAALGTIPDGLPRWAANLEGANRG
jgi:integrase/recombinase XerC